MGSFMGRITLQSQLARACSLLTVVFMAATCSSTRTNTSDGTATTLGQGGSQSTSTASTTRGGEAGETSLAECSFGATGCDGLTPLTCSEDRTWRAASAPCARACLEGACVECVEATRRCSDGAAQVCDGGSWRIDELCPVTCEDGACVTACTADRLQCSGQNQVHRCDGTKYVLIEECDYICVDERCAGECVPDQRRCNPEAPNEPQSCSAAGEWGESSACPDDSFCVRGDCKPCEPDSTRCTDTGPQLCSEDGEWIPQGACTGSTPACHGGSCVVCEPGDKRCSGNALEICDDDGSGYSLLEQCAGEHPACLETLEACGRCSTGDLQCTGDTVQRCNSDGAWEDESSCSGGESECFDGDCVECDPSVEQRRCLDADMAQSCGDDGEWGATTNCSGDTPICREDLNYTCGCNEAERRCALNVPEVCTGGVWVLQAACSGATPFCLPDSGSCEACEPGSERCVSGVANRCSDDGAWTSLDACSGDEVNCGGCDLGEDCDEPSDCTTGVCLNNVCVECSPGDHDCSGTVPRTCSSSGSWQNEAACTAPTNGSPVCSDGACDFSCATGFEKCQNRCIPNSGCCADSECSSTASCVNDACVCDTGYTGPNCVPIFEPIARVTGYDGQCQALGMSADGAVVVGFCEDSSDPKVAFRWEAGVTTVLADNGEGSDARGVSNDGTMVVGRSNSRPARWSNGTRTIHRTYVQDPSFGSGYIFDISSDKNILLGYSSDSQGPNWVYWDLSSGSDPEAIRVYTGASAQTVTGMADNGSVMSGTVSSTNPRANSWTSAGGSKLVPQYLSYTRSYAHGISSNGAVLVGEATSGDPGTGIALSWQISSGNATELGVEGYADRTNSNGTVITGVGKIDGVANTAFLWRGGAAVGLRAALAAAGADIQGWTITAITGMSPDGSILTGYGLNPSSEVQGWRVHLTGTGIGGF